MVFLLLLLITLASVRKCMQKTFHILAAAFRPTPQIEAVHEKCAILYGNGEWVGSCMPATSLYDRSAYRLGMERLQSPGTTLALGR